MKQELCKSYALNGNLMVTLLAASPCSSHGWDYKRTGRCQPKRWAACWVKAVLPHQNTVHCYYLTGKDDCSYTFRSCRGVSWFTAHRTRIRRRMAGQVCLSGAARKI